MRTCSMKPFDYQYRLRDHFRKQEKTWLWFSGEAIRNGLAEQSKTELLKNAYRLDPQAEPAVYAHVARAKEGLGIGLPVAVYRLRHAGHDHAGIFLADGEAHLVLPDAVMHLLDGPEMLALVAHELSHVLLYTLDGGDFEVTSRIAYAMANDYRSDDSYLETVRLFNLFTQVFCDLGSLRVCGDAHGVISALLKIRTGLAKASPEYCPNGPEEILAKHPAELADGSHTEVCLRAKALALFAERGEEAYGPVSELVLGHPGLFTLNVFSKVEVQENTRRLLQLLMKPDWMQTELHRAHAKLYFDDFRADAEAVLTPALKHHLERANASLKDYYAYLLLDFVFCNPHRQQAAAGLALDLAGQAGLAEAVAKAFKKEMGLSEKKFDEFAKQAAEALGRMLESDRETIYG